MAQQNFYRKLQTHELVCAAPVDIATVLQQFVRALPMNHRHTTADPVW